MTLHDLTLLTFLVFPCIAAKGIVDLITGDSNRKAQKAADKAGKGQEAIAKRITQLFDEMMGKVQGYEASGGFNPDKQIALADQQTSEARNADMTTDASTAKILGYRAGDTVPLDNLRAIDQKYKLKSEAQHYDIRQNAFGRLLNSYASLNPNSLMGAGQLYGNIQQNQLAQMKDPTDFFRTAASVYAMGQK